MLKTKDIKNLLVEAYNKNEFRVTKAGVKTVELQGAQFIADKGWIVREPNYDYAQRELEWYKAQSLNVNDIPGKTPVIWEQCADVNGDINSNYGWMIWSKENGSQYKNCLWQLCNDPATREAAMIYNRPSMHVDAFANHKHDFCCTYAVQCFLNELTYNIYALDYHVFMRSNDAVFGYDNDYYWHNYVMNSLIDDISKHYTGKTIVRGDMIWNAASLHVYERHFKFLEQ